MCAAIFLKESYMKYVPGNARNPLLKNGSEKAGREISLSYKSIYVILLTRDV